MTVPSTTRRAGPFTGTGVLTNYPFAFRVFENADVAVTLADADGVETAGVLDSTYLVTMNADQETTPGGYVQYAVGGVATALPVSYILGINGAREYSQEADLPQGGNFNARSVEDALDNLAIQIQQIRDSLDRSVRLTVLSPLTADSTLPIPEATALLGWNADGTELKNYAPDTAVSTDVLRSDLASVSSPLLGDALIGYGAVTSIIAGVLTRHASLGAAVSAVGASACTIVVRGNTSLAANTTIAATTELRIENEAQINFNTFTLTVNGSFRAGGTKCFTGTGKVVFAKGSTPFILPEWWGAKGDGAIDGSSGTDCTAALTAAIAASTDTGLSTGTSIIPVLAGAGNYITGAQSFPVAFRLMGVGRHMSNFVAKTGTAGVWFGDSGNAAKIILEDFAMYAHSVTGITYGLRLGYGTQQHGTEGYVRNLFIRDVNGASAIIGCDVNGNVGFYQRISVWNCPTNIKITGVANKGGELVSYAPTVLGADLNLCDLTSLEVEAPGNSCVPVKLNGNSAIDSLTVSLANATTISHLVELAAAATTWRIGAFNLAFGSTPAGITVSNGNFKRSDGTYFGGNATAGSRNGEGIYASEHAGQVPQCFALTIFNNAGTLQHKITEPGANGASNWASKVNGALSSFTNTPTGADGSTAFAAGGKIGSASANFFYLDVPDQKAADSQFIAFVQFNSTANPLTVTAQFVSININGVTRTRLAFQFNVDASGTGFNLNTTNIAAGKIVQVVFNGRLS